MSHALIVGVSTLLGQPLVEKLKEKHRTISIISRSDKIPDVSFFKADISESYEHIFNTCIAKNGPLDTVVFTIKSAQKGTILDIDPDTASTNLQVSIIGLIRTIQYLHSSKQQCTFVIVGGGFKDNPMESKVILSMIKAAEYSLFQSSINLLQENGIILKTCIIDGKIGEEDGEIKPNTIARSIVKLIESELEEVTVNTEME